MSIYAVVRETMRITDPAIEKTVRTPLAYSEGLAHFFGVAILNAAGTGNESLSGYTVTAHFIRGDGYYGNITGAVDGNVAYVILPSWCYRATGRFTLTVYLNSGSGSSAATRCIMIAHGRVMADTTNSMIDPDHVVPDLAALIAQMQQISAAIAKINGMTVSVSTLSPGSSATASLTTVNDHYHLALGIPQGQKGNPGNVSTVNNVSPDAQGNVALPTDATPTDSSTKYVTSGGVKSSLDSRDASILAIRSSLGIVSNKNTHAPIAAGDNVFIYNHGSIPEGLYVATQSIAENATLTMNKLNAVPAVLNDYKTAISNKTTRTNYTAAGNSSVAITLPSNSRAFVITSGTASTQKSMIILSVSSGGDVGYSIVLPGDAVSYGNTVSNQLTVTNGNNNALAVTVFFMNA